VARPASEKTGRLDFCEDIGMIGVKSYSSSRLSTSSNSEM
jgi:hypothetical protein